MRHYVKECQNMKQVNSFLKKTTGDEWFDYGYDVRQWGEFNFDSWVNSEETKGLSIVVTTDYEVFVSKYTRKDIEQYERMELAQ